MTSIIIVNYNGGDIVTRCIHSLDRHLAWDALATPGSETRVEVIVVDNGSQDGSANRIEGEFSSLRVIRLSDNPGFSVACNAGAVAAKGDALLFLNPDTEAVEDFLTPLEAELASDESIAAVTPLVLYPDERVQLTWGPPPGFLAEFYESRLARAYRRGGRLAIAFVRRRARRPRAVGWATGSCLLVRRSVFESVGGFDESFFLYFEDKDLCARIRRAGGVIRYTPRTKIHHMLGGLSGGEMGAARDAKLRGVYRESQRLYYLKHRSGLEQTLLRFYQRRIAQRGT